MRLRIFLASALLSTCVLPAAAQSVKVSFHDGRVDLSAQNATPRAILTEWARVGGTRLVNAERLSGSPMTLEFKDAYEQQVLEALLRGVSGYMLGPRVTPASATASGFDRIVLLPTSTASVAAAPRPTSATPAFGRPPGPQPLRRLPPPVDDDQDQDEPDDDASATPATPGRVETPADLRRRLGQLLQSPDDDNDADDEPPPVAAPANPFGVTTGSTRPGAITPVPPQQPRGPQPRGTNQPQTP